MTRSEVAATTSRTYATSPAGGPATRYGGISSRPSAPASSAARAYSRASGSAPPAPAKTGTRPSAIRTAVRTTSAYSATPRAWNSPVPQATKTPPGPDSIPALRWSESFDTSTEPSTPNGVTGKNRMPWSTETSSTC